MSEVALIDPNLPPLQREGPTAGFAISLSDEARAFILPYVSAVIGPPRRNLKPQECNYLSGLAMGEMAIDLRRRLYMRPGAAGKALQWRMGVPNNQAMVYKALLHGFIKPPEPDWEPEEAMPMPQDERLDLYLTGALGLDYAPVATYTGVTESALGAHRGAVLKYFGTPHIAQALARAYSSGLYKTLAEADSPHSL